MKKKVLIVTSTLNVGGLDIIATGLQKNMDKEKFDFTYYVKGEKVGLLEQSVLDDGAKVIHSPNSLKGYFGEYKYLKKVMMEDEYDIVHSHLMFFSGIVMKAAAECGIKKRIPHSHMTNPCIKNRSFVKRIIAKLYSIVMKNWLCEFGTNLIACGSEAGVYLYGKRNFNKRGIIINNAINIDKFCYNPNIRQQLRDKLNISDKLVVGHVGRLNYVKNHTFLLDVFYEILQINKDAVLLIVGDGEEKENIVKKLKVLNIEDKVIFLGVCDNVNEYLCAMDVFVFPSLYEGVPVTLVEAQATKLPCIVSDSVSKYVKHNDNVKFISLKESTKKWAECAVEATMKDRSEIDDTKLKKNYDIKQIAKQLEKIYLD